MGREFRKVIVEGVDGSGKSTLIQSLLDRFHFLELVPGGKKPDMPKFWHDWTAPLTNELVPIHDRFFYSELIYGPLIRGQIDAPDYVVRNVRHILRGTAFLIYCRPPNQALWMAVEAKPQMDGVKEQFRRLRDAYDSLIYEEAPYYPANRFIRYDWTGNSTRILEDRLEFYLENGP